MIVMIVNGPLAADQSFDYAGMLRRQKSEHATMTSRRLDRVPRIEPDGERSHPAQWSPPRDDFRVGLQDLKPETRVLFGCAKGGKRNPDGLQDQH